MNPAPSGGGAANSLTAALGNQRRQDFGNGGLALANNYLNNQDSINAQLQQQVEQQKQAFYAMMGINRNGPFNPFR